jgi:hypothetical protein
MAHDLKLEFVIPNVHPDHEVRAEKLVETLVDQVLPKMAASMSLNEDEVFARLVIELGHIIGITHAPDSALSMIGMMTDAILQGQQAARETSFQGSANQDVNCDEIFEQESDSNELEFQRINRLDPSKNATDLKGDEEMPIWVAQCSPVRH